jgi:hypothetical protein
MHPDDTDQRVCYETIYAAIYAHPRGPEEITLLFGVKTRLALDSGTGPVVHGGRGGRSRCGDVLAVAIKKRRRTASLPRIEGCLLRAATLLRVRNFSRRNRIGYSTLRPHLFATIDETLTREKIVEITNTDLHTVNIEGIDHPAKLLAKILSSVGIKYQKSRDNAEMLVGNLNLSELHLEGPQRSSSLGEFVEHVEKAFA